MTATAEQVLEKIAPSWWANVSALSVAPRSRSTLVISTPAMPHGVIWPNGARSPHTFSANPCIVIQRRTPTPIDAIFFHRKLAGVFLLASRVDAHVFMRPLLKSVLQSA